METVYVPKHYGGIYDGDSWSERIESQELLEEDSQYPKSIGRMIQFCEEHPANSVSEAEQVIRDEFEANLEYTYQPGSTPEDRDFAEYFLFDNRRGFCVHFATAAVLLYRVYGYPARFVEGYAVKPSEFTGRCPKGCENSRVFENRWNRGTVCVCGILPEGTLSSNTADENTEHCGTEENVCGKEKCGYSEPGSV